MRHFTHISDLGVEGVSRILDRAVELKSEPRAGLFAGRILAMLFFNPSLRTRVSFETAMLRGGGHAIVLSPGQDSWKLEDRPGVKMDGDRPEHLREAIPVLSRYADALAVRSFAGLVDRDADERDGLLWHVRDLSTVALISMESAREHPCQGLADMLTIREHVGAISKTKLALTWAPHIKPLPLAVPHSFLLSAAACGADLTIAHPPGFDLHPAVLREAEEYTVRSGGMIRFTDNQSTACADADVVYAKSWGPVQLEHAPQLLAQHSDWLVTRALLESGSRPAQLMHCLPVRRNVEVSDDALDSPLSLVIEEAHNRYFVQAAILDWLLNGDDDD